MAGPIGGTAGYLTINPTQNYIGEAAKEVQDTVTRFRAEKYQKDRDKVADQQYQEEQNRKNFKEVSAFNEKYPFISTGTSLDSANMQALQNGKQTYADAMLNYNKTGDKRYLATAQNAIASINNTNEMPKALSLKVQDWQTNEADYNPSSLASKQAILTKMKNGDLMQDNDANGRAVYTLVDRDESGNVTKVLYDKLNAKKLMDLLEVEPKFNVTGDKGFIDQYQKSIGKPITIKNSDGNTKTEITKTPGASEIAKSMAIDATQNRSAVYTALEQLGLDPEDKKNYSNPEVLTKVSNYYEDILKSTAPEVKSEEADFERRKYNLSVEKEANDEKQRKIDNAFKSKAQKLKEDEAKGKEAKIGVAKTVTTGNTTLNGVKVAKGDKVTAVSDSGTKDSTGFKRTLKEVVVHKDGIVTYSFEEDNPADWIPTKEGQARMDANPDYKPTGNDYIPQKPRKANYTTSGKNAKANEVEAGILNIKNPETGEFFKSTVESDDYFKRKSTPKKTDTPKKVEYSNVTETDKGTIGVKNGKWYYVKTGKIAQ